jgi:hypothetical protein
MGRYALRRLPDPERCLDLHLALTDPGNRALSLRRRW